MAWPYCEHLMTWLHCERLDGLSSQISCEQQWHDLTVLTLMAQSHKYISHIPPINSYL